MKPTDDQRAAIREEINRVVANIKTQKHDERQVMIKNSLARAQFYRRLAFVLKRLVKDRKI
jgi:hypothetical protein